jgi:hypothetical protein
VLRALTGDRAAGLAVPATTALTAARRRLASSRSSSLSRPPTTGT